MNQITNISVDVSHPQILIVHEKQNDSGRWIYASITDNGMAFDIPLSAVGIVRVAKPDGTACVYDSDTEGSAVVISGNTVRVKLVDQVLTSPGTATMSIGIFSSDTGRITAFNFLLDIEKDAVNDQTIVSTDYYNILTAQIAHVVQMYEDTQGMTVSASTLDPLESATAVISGGSGSPLHISFGLPRGLTGLSTAFIAFTNNGQGFEINDGEWLNDGTYDEFPYSYTITLAPLATSSMIPFIIPDMASYNNENLSYIADMKNGKVKIYSNANIHTLIKMVLVIESNPGGN